MSLSAITGENFDVNMAMPQMFWHGFYVLYDHTLSEERRARMLRLIGDYVVYGGRGRCPPIKRIELHASPDGSSVQGYVVVVLEKITKVFEYKTEEI